MDWFGVLGSQSHYQTLQPCARCLLYWVRHGPYRAGCCAGYGKAVPNLTYAVMATAACTLDKAAVCFFNSFLLFSNLKVCITVEYK